jgi:hypothetical protein
MAEIFPNEGLDGILAVIPRGGTTPANTYMGLFTSQTASTVPSADAVLSTYAGTAAPAEPTIGTNAYARQAIAAASWGAPATSGSGRRTTAGAVTFPTSTSTGWGTINGFFLASASAHGSEFAWYYANFSDLASVAINSSGYTLTVTPYWHIDQ